VEVIIVGTLRRPGYSLIECLIAIGIVCLLAALITPAVQKAREAAIRSACSNNLRQIGIGCHGFHDVYKRFPAGMRWQGGRDPCAYMSWLAQILPFIDQDSLSRRTLAAYKLTQGQNPAFFPATGPHEELFATPVATFACPADQRVASTQFLQIWRFQHPVALTSYLGVNGRNYLTRDGVLFRDSQIRIADVKDGTTSTLLAGERPPTPQVEYGWWYAAAGQQWTGSCQFLLGVQELLANDPKVICRRGAYSFGPGSFDNECDMYHFWSPHFGGANFVFADGSVHFLAYSAAPIMPALASRAGGEAVPIPE
jgi:prepilin-type N-terminal cleavage/methylation domain-containing protein/prepilin-type processing-associated H-X9-DG protein